MTDQHLESSEASEQHDDSTPPPKSGRAAAVWVSLGVVASLLVGCVVFLDNAARFVFHDLGSSAYLAGMIVSMCFAVGVPLAVIVGWIIRRRHLAKTGRRLRWAPLVTAAVCLLLGSPSIFSVASVVRIVEQDAVIAFEESLDDAAVEADGIAHLEWMTERLQLTPLGEPEVRRESCIRAGGVRGVAPVVTIRAEERGARADPLLSNLAMSFWRADGYDPMADAEGTVYLTGVPLEDPYTEILFAPHVPTRGTHELTYHAVCMALPEMVPRV
ncbi:hypothetical protein GE115_10175 [Agromyces sp. CFH 90414]|uniref:Uncharacterized protein n=1 Tax=Agromyces agglutinans TaxID=2662258 RepID=A0A6I2F7E9_9MICO|nr:hypothetical protein [Agromyces agglutinans]MRG60231.1 hypothetical protein [Agromyces agglutinans]